jgi:hypothetical protein
MRSPPGGKPVPDRTNLGDTEWMLTKFRRWIFEGGDSTDPRYREQLNLWLDYRNELRGSRLEHVGTTRELAATPGPDA